MLARPFSFLLLLPLTYGCTATAAPTTAPAATETEVTPPATALPPPNASAERLRAELPLAAPAVTVTAAATASPTRLAPIAGCSRSATVLLVDRSGSMSGLPIDMAKAGATEALARLDGRDCFGVFAFDSAPARVVPITRVVDRGAMQAQIATIAAGGGTDIGEALAAAATDLKAVSSGGRRGVILLTDGQSPTQGLTDLVTAMSADGIAISTIGLGSGVDPGLLRTIADRGNGRLTLVRDPYALRSAILREMSLMTGQKE